MADLAITPANVVAGEGAIREDGIAGEAITAGKVVYRDATTGQWFLASHVAEDEGARIAFAIALNNAATGQPLAAQALGPLMLGAVLTSGGTYYLSDTPGRICLAGDLAADEFVSIVGMAKSSIMLDVKMLSAYVPDTGGGVPRYRTFDGILYQLLLGPTDGAPFQGADGYYLYGVA